MHAINNQAEQDDDILPVAFGHQAQLHLQHYAQLPERDLFYYLINIDEFPAVGACAQHFVAEYLKRAASLSGLPEHLVSFSYTPEACTARMQLMYAQQLAAGPELAVSNFTEQQLRGLLKQAAPAALLDGCCLQNISLAATNHTEVVSRLFYIYAEKIGDGNTAKHYANQYQDLLRSARIYLPEPNTRLFTTRKDLPDFAFVSPVFQLALSQFPRVYLPEIIGFTLGHFFNSENSLLSACFAQIRQLGLDERYCQHYKLAEHPDKASLMIQEAVQHYLEGFADPAQREKHWQRIWNGLLVHHLLKQKFLQAVLSVAGETVQLTPQQKMLAMVREKARYARNMHRSRKVGGQLINDWFAQEPFDAEGFLQALATSPHVNLEQPLESDLIQRSISFGGPMFRIFTDAEQTIIAEWLQSLATPQSASVTEVAAPSATKAKPAIPLVLQNDNLELISYAKCNKRQLYHYFVNADLYPDVLPTARKIAQQYFKQAKAEMRKWGLAEQLRWFPYSHAAFEARIRLIYDTEIQAYEEFVAPSTVPREIMVWYVQQYAPFPMVDGSWVQHIAKAGMSHTEISARLFRIYSDEVGNADTVLNHPNVYRRMLEQEGITMPPTDSMEFVMQPALRDFAFDLPLLTLSVSMFPKAFLPEIIGVNLAIELSGLGKGYMQIIDELRYWEMDPYFFTLHLTIDNIASGHTAVAMETVHIYLDQILTSQGQELMQREWERIWIGYLAFKQCMTRFDSTLEREAGLRFLMPLIRQNLQHLKAKNQNKLAKIG